MGRWLGHEKKGNSRPHHMWTNVKDLGLQVYSLLNKFKSILGAKKKKHSFFIRKFFLQEGHVRGSIVSRDQAGTWPGQLGYDISSCFGSLKHSGPGGLIWTNNYGVANIDF